MKLALLRVGVAFGATSYAGEASIEVAPADSAVVSPTKLLEGVGINTTGGAFTALLRKGCSLPCSMTSPFSTREGQQVIEIHLYRGQSALISEAVSLGTYQISGFQSASAAKPRILVTLTADSSGIRLNAKDEIDHKATLVLDRLAP
jgi:molecular chaperone DnaK (HSP70)